MSLWGPASLDKISYFIHGDTYKKKNSIGPHCLEDFGNIVKYLIMPNYTYGIVL